MADIEQVVKWQEDNYLLATVIQSGLLWAIGDTLCQVLERPKKPYSPIRFLRHSSFGAIVYAPLAYLWYAIALQMTIPSEFHQVLADQLLWTPPILCIMFLWTSLWQGKSLKDGFRLIRSELWKTLRINWILWPCVQAINLSIMPVNIPWTAFLSLASNRKTKADAQMKTPTHVNLPSTV